MIEMGVRDIQECPFGEAYVRLNFVRDRDRLVNESPIPFGDVHLTFTNHNQGCNWRSLNFNRICWIMIVGVPLDFCNTEKFSAAVRDFGKLIHWDLDEGQRGRIIMKVRVTELVDVPKSI